MATVSAVGQATKDGKKSLLEAYLKAKPLRIPISLSSISLASLETSDDPEPQQQCFGKNCYTSLAGSEAEITLKMVERLRIVELTLDSELMPVNVKDVKEHTKMCTLMTDIPAFKRRRNQLHDSKN